MVKHQIGAGGRVYIASAGAPTVVTRTETYDKTDYVRGFNINMQIGNDDVTTLNADEDNFAQRFIQALMNATGTMDCLYGAPLGTFLLFLDAIRKGNLHTLGRGKVDWIYDPFGSTTGYLSFAGTFMFSTIPLTGELGRAVGGQIGFQVDGEPQIIAVP